MKAFPMFLRTSGRTITILGGGEQAAQKTRLALKTDARIVVASATALEPELKALRDENRIQSHDGPVTAALFQPTALTFIATGCKGADAALHTIAKEAGALINVVDQPDLCDALTPSIVDRDPVVVAIGTEGTAPVLARQIKTRVEEMLEPRLGGLAALAGRLRATAAHHLSPSERRTLWRWVFAGAPRRAYTGDREREAAQMIKSAIQNRDIPTEALPAISLVSTGNGSRDMITLRAVKRLQEADIIFSDPLADPDTLELARRDAQRETASPFAPKLAQQIRAAAAAGERVIWLTSANLATDPRAEQVAQDLKEHGIEAEQVQGVFSRENAAPLAATA